jgi:hypothetical protein
MNSDVLERLLIDHEAGELSPDVEQLLEHHLRRDPIARQEAAEIAQTLRLARHALAGEPVVALHGRRPALPFNRRAWGVAACVACAGLLGAIALRERHASPQFATSFPVQQVAVAPRVEEPGFWSARRFRSALTAPRLKDDLRLVWTSPVRTPEPISK